MDIRAQAVEAFGEPNARLSTDTELRFGSKGSISVDLTKGVWYDFEADGGGGLAGLLHQMHATTLPPSPQHRRVPPEVIEHIRGQLQDARNTRVDLYLAGRGIAVSALKDIGYHHNLWHQPSGTWWPAMVATVRNGRGKVVAVHRTWLTHYSYPPTKAPIEPNKMSLGPARGGAVHLAAAGPKLVIAEGIETTASAMALLQLPGWAALFAGNMANVVLPKLVREVVIAADNDAAGIKAAIKAAWCFQSQGRLVEILKPSAVGDFNDLLQVVP
jgi:hypothetical protein